MRYEYQAISKFPDITLILSEAYAANAFSAMLWAAIFAFALVLFTAIAIKKARPYGIIVAIMQPLGLFAAMKTVLAYATMDFSGLEMTVTSNVSLDDAMEKLYAAIGEKVTTDILPGFIMMLPWLILSLATFIMTLIYFANISKKTEVGRGWSKAALVITIIKFIIISPIESTSLMLQKSSETIQAGWDTVYHLFFLLPLILAAVQGIVTLVANAKAKKAQAAAPAAEAVTTEAPVAEAPVAEAPVAEAADTNEEA